MTLERPPISNTVSINDEAAGSDVDEVSKTQFWTSRSDQWDGTEVDQVLKNHKKSMLPPRGNMLIKMP